MRCKALNAMCVAGLLISGCVSEEHKTAQYEKTGQIGGLITAQSRQADETLERPANKLVT